MSSDPPHPSIPPTAGDLGSTELSARLQRGLDRVQARIDAAVTSAGPGAKTPTLIAVTKTVPANVTLALAELLPDPCHLAENRADVFQGKVAALAGKPVTPRWHFIGSIQRNKARRILQHADVLHSIDSARLADTVARLADELERDVEVFLEVNATGESEKHGLQPAELAQLLDHLASSARVRVAGIMAMGPARGARSVDEVFHEVAGLARSLETSHSDSFVDSICRLSMGMSGDLEAAIRHGSDYVRIGSALFQELAPGPLSSPGPTSQ